MSAEEQEVVVVGGGNAGFAAAHAAAERGRQVLLLEKGTRSQAGGNSYYTAGAFRIAHNGLAEIADLLDPDERHPSTVLPPYPAEEFAADMAKVTGGRNDPVLTDVLIRDSQDVLRWLHGKGLRFRLMYERQAYPDADGQQVFWGGLTVGSTGGGKGLIEQHTAAAVGVGVEIRYGAHAGDLVIEDGRVAGVTWQGGTVRAESVVLAAGGFEANASWRAALLGEGCSGPRCAARH